MKPIDLSLKRLKDLNACKEGIDFVIKNNMSNRKIIDWEGDYNEFIEWNVNCQDYTFTYDDQGNMLTKACPDGSVWTCTYDDKGNMLTETYPSGNMYTFTYDDQGNMLTETYPNGNVYTFTYDDQGNMLTHTYPSGRVYTFTYDDQGNMLTKACPNGEVYTWTYTWTDDNTFIVTRNNKQILKATFEVS